MPYADDSRQTGPARWLVLLLCTVFLVTGLLDHDPWKVDDAVHLSIVQGMVESGDWHRPAVAGEPWPEAEPLYHWVAAGSALVLQPLLGFPAAARLASALFGAVFLLLLAAAGRQNYGAQAAWGTPLLAIGTLGLLIPLHEAQPASAILAAMALAYWGCALLATHAIVGALALGLGIAATFLAGGLNAALPLLPLLAAPALMRQWLGSLVVMAAVAVGCLWLIVLAQTSPHHLSAWWTTELRLLAPREGFSRDHLELLGWFAWPVLYVALWALWKGRRQLAAPAYALPLLGVVSAAGWYLTHEPRLPAALPLLPPLILLAAAGTPLLRRGAANAWDWFGMMTFTLVAGLLWLGAVATLTGWPPRIARNFVKLEPGFVAEFSLAAIAVALAATLFWAVTLLRLPRSPWRVASRWAAGLTVMWVLLVALMMPWIDYGKTYRPVFASLRQTLPAEPGCIGRQNLGLAQRALLDYYTKLRTQAATDGCQWLMTQGGPAETMPEGWSLVWEGHRPGDRHERLRLYRRD